MLRFSVPPGYQRQQPIKRPKLDPLLGVIDAMLTEDKTRPAKQRHTVKRIFERLKEEHGFTGGYSIVKNYVRGEQLRSREMFVPLVHPPGEAQADFGEAVVVIAGVEQKAHFLVMDLPHSDDTKIAVARILGGEERTKTKAFLELQSHYLFVDKFGRPAKGNDKGKVEGLVGYVRRNFMVPIPHFNSWEDFNAHLAEQCRKRRERRLRGHTETIGERFERDRAAMLPLPAAPYEACEKVSTRVTSLSLVRYRGNDYSVPTPYGHREVLVKGYVHEVVIASGSRVIARHTRSYEREDVVYDPLHYLELLEQKTRALDQAAPLVGWKLPECFTTLRRLLGARLNKHGSREYIQVLRLMETFSVKEVTCAIEDALLLGTISFDAVKHLLLCRIERRPPRLDMENYPHLPMAAVHMTLASDYMTLLMEVPA
jgi:transposase